MWAALGISEGLWESECPIARHLECAQRLTDIAAVLSRSHTIQPLNIALIQ